MASNDPQQHPGDLPSHGDASAPVSPPVSVPVSVPPRANGGSAAAANGTSTTAPISISDAGLGQAHHAFPSYHPPATAPAPTPAKPHHSFYQASNGSVPMSIWASPPHKTSPDFGATPLRGRARAGTLPSRLPTLNLDRVALDRVPPTGALGSLALMSPEGNNEVLWDPPATDPAPPGPASAVHHHSTTGATTPSTVGSRSRSGSLNSLAFSPFPSIWNGATPPTSSSAGAAAEIRPGAEMRPAEIRPTPSPPRYPDMLGGLRAATNDPQRARAYTAIDAGWPGAHVPVSVGSSLFGRPRAHTLVASPPLYGRFSQSQSQSQSLGLGLSQNLVHERTPEGQLVVLGDLSGVPTPALWIANVPPTATSYQMHALFGGYGAIETARVVPGHGCAYVLFASVHAAVDAQAATNGLELYAGRGPSAVGFARILEPSPPPAKHPLPVPVPVSVQQIPHAAPPAPTQPQPQPQPQPQSIAQSMAQPMAQPQPLLQVPPTGKDDNLAYILQSLDAGPQEVAQGVAHFQRARHTAFDQPLSAHAANEDDDDAANRVYTAGVLREVRRRMDSMVRSDIDELALDMQAELPALASDYIGNTVVQQLFERTSPVVRDMMLRRLVPVLAQTGTHKNGTWAAQKVIDLVDSPRQYALVEEAIRPHLVALLLDQFGNYVVQGCLKFGAPWNDFVYAGVATLLPMIAMDRFGARAVCAILKSPHTTVRQQRLIAAVVVEDAVHLASNANGSLLLNWLLDSFVMAGPARFALVAAQFASHLADMATSKTASSILLKVIASGQDMPAARTLLDALLEPASDAVPAVLERTLLDPSGHGATFLFRLLTTALGDASLEKQVAANKIRMILLQPGIAIPPHKRLLEEVGLSMLAESAPAVPVHPHPNHHHHGHHHGHHDHEHDSPPLEAHST